MLRRVLLMLAASERLKELAGSMPVSSALVARYVAGETTDQAVTVAGSLAADRLNVSIDYLGEHTTDRDQAERTVDAYTTLLTDLAAADLAAHAEVSVKLSAVGQALPGSGAQIGLDNARRICSVASDIGTTVTIDMEDHTTTDSTLEAVTELRRDFPDTGAVLQAYLHRTEGDCKDLAGAGSRVRLCKGAYKEPESVAYQGKHDVRLAYVRCLKVLMAGDGYPMVATHDPRLVEIAETLAVQERRDSESYEFQMLFGIRPEEQRRLAGQGKRVRVYVPYGDQWYGYLMRRLAERPSNLAFFVRSLVSKR